MPVTRTSLPGGAVVAVWYRWRASRLDWAPRSWAARSTAGRQAEVRIVGRANRARAASHGLIETSSQTVTPRRSTQPAVENSDMYRWSSTNTCSRRTVRRSSHSGRSWWAMVATDAWSRATCASRAIVTRSRKRRWTRASTVRSTQVAAADSPRPTAATSSSRRSPSSTPLPSRASHRASRASGRAAASDSRKEATSSPGSWR